MKIETNAAQHNGLHTHDSMPNGSVGIIVGGWYVGQWKCGDIVVKIPGMIVNLTKQDRVFTNCEKTQVGDMPATIRLLDGDECVTISNEEQ
jgi:hypothetical protein